MAKHVTPNKNVKKLDDLKDYIGDLSPEERTRQETADEMYKTLKHIVDEKNSKAHLYQADFNKRLQKRVEDKTRKPLLEKFFGTSDPKKLKTEMFKPENMKNYENFKKAEKATYTLKRQEYNKIFEIFKRAYNKEIGMHKGNDIDKKAIHFLLKKSGFYNDASGKRFFTNIQEVHHGKSLDKGLTVDSGGTITGIKIENTKKTTGQGHKTLIGSKAILDEHADGSPKSETTNRPTSTTHIVYTMLKSLNKIQKKEKEQIQRFVDFVDIVDGYEYQASGIDYENQHKTIFGLHHQLPIEDIYKYFANPKHTGFEILSEDDLNKNFINKTYRKKGKKTNENISRKTLSDKQGEKLENSLKSFSKLNSKRGLSFNGHRFTVLFDNEIEYGPQAATYAVSGTIKIGIDKETKQPYLYIFNPFEKFTRSIGGIKPDGHFLHKKNINKETLEKVLNEFGYTNDYIFTKLPKKLVRKDIMKYINSITPLPTLDVEKLTVGETLTGIIKNTNNNLTHIALGENVSGAIKTNGEALDMKPGEKIQVKIINISKKDKNKTRIELQVA